jgi:hypothetical protein
MDFISKLPHELVIHIYEYNPQHREQMRWVLHVIRSIPYREQMRWILDDIRNTPYCEVCDKIIIKYIYSLRRCGMICCSSECVDNY